MKRGRRIDLSLNQIVAGALATATATVVASYFGVAGTVIGAALMSVVSTAAGAVYGHYLHRTGERLRSAGAYLDQAALRLFGGRTQAAARSGTRADAGTAGTTAVGQGLDAGDGRRWGTRLRWPVLVGTAAAIFVVVMGGVTAVEMIAGRPLSSMVQGKAGYGTTLGGGRVEPRGVGPAPTRDPARPTSTAPAAPVGPVTTPGGGPGAGTPHPAPSRPASVPTPTGQPAPPATASVPPSSAPRPTGAPTQPGRSGAGSTGSASGGGAVPAGPGALPPS